MTVPETDIALYTSGTPNGQKISIVLEELGIKYETTHVDITKGDQKEEWYLKINPNGRIPAIVDRTASSKRIFESGAIMLYLCQKYDPEGRISYPFDSSEYWEVVEWLIWMQSGLGPMQGQANHFYRYAPEKHPYSIKRYQTETKRLYQVLEDRLLLQKSTSPTSTPNSSSGPWLVGTKCTIADLNCFAWVNWDVWAGVDAGEFTELKKWQERIAGREAVKRGLDVPQKFELREKMKSKEGEEEYQKMHSDWVMKGQNADQEKHK